MTRKAHRHHQSKQTVVHKFAVPDTDGSGMRSIQWTPLIMRFRVLLRQIRWYFRMGLEKGYTLTLGLEVKAGNTHRLFSWLLCQSQFLLGSLIILCNRIIPGFKRTLLIFSFLSTEQIKYCLNILGNLLYTLWVRCCWCRGGRSILQFLHYSTTFQSNKRT